MGNSYTSRGDPRPFDFELDEVQWTCPGGVTLLDLSEFAKMADADMSSPEGAAAIADLFRAAMGAEQYQRFRRHCREHHTDEATLATILMDLVAHVIGNPTERSRPSSPGPQSTPGTWKVDLPETHPLTDEEIERWRAGVARAASDTRTSG